LHHKLVSQEIEDYRPRHVLAEAVKLYQQIPRIPISRKLLKLSYQKYQ